MKILKLLGKLFAGVAVLLVLAVGIVFALAERRIATTFDVMAVVSIETNSDSATLALGSHVAGVRGCKDCHEPDLSGRTFMDVGPIGTFTGSNLTAGAGGVRSLYQEDDDWVRAIRHGVRPDGTPLMVMPSYEYGGIGPQDLGALVSWIKSMPAVDSGIREQRIGPLGKVLFVTGQLPLFSAEVIDHEGLNAGDFSQPDVGVTVEYGEYIAYSCTGCHMTSYSGGPMPGMPPDYPPAGNLTPDVDTGLGSWTEENFMSFFADGTRPDGRRVDPVYMPWNLLGQAMTETELRAVWTYLRTLPAMPIGGN